MIDTKVTAVKFYIIISSYKAVIYNTDFLRSLKLTKGEEIVIIIRSSAIICRETEKSSNIR